MLLSALTRLLSDVLNLIQFTPSQRTPHAAEWWIYLDIMRDPAERDSSVSVRVDTAEEADVLDPVYGVSGVQLSTPKPLPEARLRGDLRRFVRKGL